MKAGFMFIILGLIVIIYGLSPRLLNYQMPTELTFIVWGLVLITTGFIYLRKKEVIER
jgi:predicted membrane channel-forming protein YqfA (hemolysin III family)